MMFPPLIEGGGAGSRERGSEDNMEERQKIHRPLPPQVESDCGRDQDKKCQPCLHELREVGHRPAAFERDYVRFDQSGFHFTLTATSPVVCRSRHGS